MKQEESFANHIPYNGLISKIYKELNSVEKTIDNLIFKVFFFFSEEDIQMVNRYMKRYVTSLIISSVQSLSHAWLSATPWTTVCQASLSITISRSLPKPMSIESVMPSNHLILCHPLLLLPSIFPSLRVFPMSQLFASGGQSIGVSASTSVLPMNTQYWSPLGWTGWPSSGKYKLKPQ